MTSIQSRLRTAYARSPAALQQAMFYLEGARVARKRYGGDYEAIYAAAAERLTWSAKSLIDYRDRRLVGHLRYVTTFVPRFRQYGPEVADGLDALSETLPIMTKTEVADDPESFFAANGRGTVPVSTGGTTGDPLTFRSTRRALQEQWAMWWRYRAVHGITPEVKSGHFGGQAVVPTAVTDPPFWRVNPTANLVYFSANHLNAATARHYIGEINRREIRWLHGYPTLLKALAHHVTEQRLDLHAPMLWITTGAESVTSADRQLLGDVFGGMVRQHYGLAEAAVNLSECGRGMLHVDEDHSFVEFLPAQGGLVRLVGTSLSNRATAFVRYDTGDLARLGSPCGCGLPGRTVAGVEGRQTDFLTVSSGALVGPVNQIAKALPAVVHLQLLDHGDDRVTALVVPRGPFDDEVERQLTARIEERSPVPLDVSVEVLEEPIRTSQGKVRAVLTSR